MTPRFEDTLNGAVGIIDDGFAVCVVPILTCDCSRTRTTSRGVTEISVRILWLLNERLLTK